MKRIMCATIAPCVMFALLAVVATAQAQGRNLTGIWSGHASQGGAPLGLVVLNLRQDGERVTGTIRVREHYSSGEGGFAIGGALTADDKPIKNGKIQGGILTFEVARARGMPPLSCKLVRRGNSMWGPDLNHGFYLTVARE